MVRLDRIATRTGDGGETGLADGRRLPKDDPAIEALGAVDEANCLLGLVRIEALPPAIDAELARVQNDLFDLGADLATPRGGPHEARIPRVAPTQVARLDAALAEHNAPLAPLASFVLPGGSPAASWLHLARATVRRAERAVVAAARAGLEPGECLRYLNRLGDLLFVLARRCNDEGRADRLWTPGAHRG